MLKILTRIGEGRGREGDIETVEELAELQREATLCALGQGAAGPALSAIQHFRDEVDAHIKEKRCPALVCKALSPAGRG
jgi:NADH-quinone oxidoreductase subunit F